MTGTLIEIQTFVGRSVRHSARSLDAALVAVVLPVLILMMFVFVFGGAIDVGAGTDYLTYVVPGIVVLCAAFGSAATAVSVNHDLSTGMIDRVRSLPVVPSSVLVGHVVANVLRNLLSTAIVLVVAVLIGFRPVASWPAWLAVAGLLALFMAAVAAMSAVWGLLVRAPEAADAISFVALFAPYVSSAFVPTDTMPGPLAWIAVHQPTTPLVETLRGLLLGQPVDGTAWVAVGWCLAFLILGVVASGRLFRHRTS